jgi:hypothetical protein
MRLAAFARRRAPRWDGLLEDELCPDEIVGWTIQGGPAVIAPAWESWVYGRLTLGAGGGILASAVRSHSGFRSLAKRNGNVMILIKSRKWGHEIDGKRVEFRITYAAVVGEVVVEGVGEFLVRGNCVERMAIDIVVPHPEEFFDNLYHLTESSVEKIEIQPDQTVAHYRCVGRFDPSTS